MAKVALQSSGNRMNYAPKKQPWGNWSAVHKTFSKLDSSLTPTLHSRLKCKKQNKEKYLYDISGTEKDVLNKSWEAQNIQGKIDKLDYVKINFSHFIIFWLTKVGSWS